MRDIDGNWLIGDDRRNCILYVGCHCLRAFALGQAPLFVHLELTSHEPVHLPALIAGTGANDILGSAQVAIILAIQLDMTGARSGWYCKVQCNCWNTSNRVKKAQQRLFTAKLVSLCINALQTISCRRRSKTMHSVTRLPMCNAIKSHNLCLCKVIQVESTVYQSIAVTSWEI